MLTKIKGGLMLGFDNVLHTAGFRKRFFVAVAGTTTALATTFATAQANNALLEEVYVTAQKKSVAEAVQDVPIAISAYSGRKIEAMFAVDLTDIGFTAPNVQLTPQGTVPGTANFSIRGWGTTGQSIPSSDPAVGVVQDGVAFGTIYGVVTDVFDIESLEVLRGPQGTLFGRNVSAGCSFCQNDEA
jgi:iron complex outermembrane receptor protein